MRAPSGDQTGEESLHPPRVSWRTRDPLVSAIQRLLRVRSSILSTQPRVKITWRPSGEICGPLTVSISRYVSVSSRR